MKILFVAAEVAPFVSVGGLSQVMYFLPRALSALGHDVRVFTPKYGAMEAAGRAEGKTWHLAMETEGLSVPVEHNGKDATNGHPKNLICNVKSLASKKPNPHMYFLENREYYELRANVFGYADDHVRFALLSKGCLEWLLQRRILNEKLGDSDKAWWPDVIQCNDWHTGYFIELARQDKRYRFALAKVPLVLTVHNFFFQGNSDFRYIAPEDRDDGKKELEPLLSPKLKHQNALLRGIGFADAINTVSPTHAIEVLTEEYGSGLENELQKSRGKLIGILNGLDTKEFNPSTDPIIKKHYNMRSFISARRENKLDLQRSFQLPEDLNIPLLAICGRLSQQKGFDLLVEVFPHVFDLKQNVQVIILGGGDDGYYRDKFQKLQKQYPEQLGLHLRPDFRLPRKLFGGADMFLIPSLFEPGGIVALEALRYGAVPIVRRTGGLNDVIEDFDTTTGKGNGFSFREKNPWALFSSIVEALSIYPQKTIWNKLVQNCLKCDFSWEHSAHEYEEWYKRAIEERRRATSLTPHPAYSVLEAK